MDDWKNVALTKDKWFFIMWLIILIFMNSRYLIASNWVEYEYECKLCFKYYDFKHKNDVRQLLRLSWKN